MESSLVFGSTHVQHEYDSHSAVLGQPFTVGDGKIRFCVSLSIPCLSLVDSLLSCKKKGKKERDKLADSKCIRSRSMQSGALAICLQATAHHHHNVKLIQQSREYGDAEFTSLAIHLR